MAERALQIRTGGPVLESLYEEASGTDAVILCHPHPLYGGSLYNNVVATMQTVFAGQGLSTLRFNSRGVGGSGGKYEEGEAEAEDLLRIADFLRELGKNEIHLGGYSFGAWISLMAIKKGLLVSSSTLVSPPLDFMDFSGLSAPSDCCLVVAGDRDAFCSMASLNKWFPGPPVDKNLEIAILPDCDHFYGGFEEAFADKIRMFLQRFRKAIPMS